MNPLSSSNPQIDFVLITALAEERDAVLAKLPGHQKLPPINDDIRTYFQAELPITFPDGSNGVYRVVVMCLSGMGRVASATATTDSIRRWHPRYVMLVGIAGGIAARKIQLGDILISDQIVDYEQQKQTAGESKIRWDVQRADPRLLNASNNYRGESWQDLIKIERPRQGKPNRHIGPIASGDKVVAFTEILNRYQDMWPKLLGVEMEAAGVATAAFQSPDRPGFLMVRGVSDLADENKGSSQVEKWRSYACDVAASFAIALLRSGPVPLLGELVQIKHKQVAPIKIAPDDPLFSIKERLIELSKREQIPIACIGGVYLDFLIKGIELNENDRHYLDFTREIPIRLETQPGGSIYYVARYLSELGRNPLIVSSIGDGRRNGFADKFFEGAKQDKLGSITETITKRDAATAVTIHFVHPDAKQGNSAMYTDRDVLKSFGWLEALDILRNRGGENKQIYDNGAIYIAGFFKTNLYRQLHKNLKELRQNGAIIFLDHGRLESNPDREAKDQIRSLANSLQLIDVYLSTEDELYQFIREVARDMPERIPRSLRLTDPLTSLIDQIAQEANIEFPSIMLIKDRSGKPRTHRLGIRKSSGKYNWKLIKPRSPTLPPNSEYSVGSSNAFNASFIDAFLRTNGEINIDVIAGCAQEARNRLVNVEAGRRIDSPLT
jgi:nucleoside phosphorylase/sugar/nucleoside kinase (ribokinase family)